MRPWQLQPRHRARRHEVAAARGRAGARPKAAEAKKAKDTAKKTKEEEKKNSAEETPTSTSKEEAARQKITKAAAAKKAKAPAVSPRRALEDLQFHGGVPTLQPDASLAQPPAEPVAPTTVPARVSAQLPKILLPRAFAGEARAVPPSPCSTLGSTAAPTAASAVASDSDVD